MKEIKKFFNKKNLKAKIIYSSLFITALASLIVLPLQPILENNSSVSNQQTTTTTTITSADQFYTYFENSTGVSDLTTVPFQIQDPTSGFYLDPSNAYSDALNGEIVGTNSSGDAKWVPSATGGWFVQDSSLSGSLLIQGSRAGSYDYLANLETVNHNDPAVTTDKSGIVGFAQSNDSHGFQYWNLLVNDQGQIAFQSNSQYPGNVTPGYLTPYANSFPGGYPTANVDFQPDPFYFNIVWMTPLDSTNFFSSVTVTTLGDIATFTLTLDSNYSGSTDLFIIPNTLDTSVQGSPEKIMLTGITPGVPYTIQVDYSQWGDFGTYNAAFGYFDEGLEWTGDLATVNIGNNSQIISMTQQSQTETSVTLNGVVEFDPAIQNVLQYQIYNSTITDENEISKYQWITIDTSTWTTDGTTPNSFTINNLSPDVNSWTVNFRLNGGESGVNGQWLSETITTTSGGTASTINFAETSFNTTETNLSIPYTLTQNDGTGQVSYVMTYTPTTLTSATDLYNYYHLQQGMYFEIQDPTSGMYLDSGIAYNQNESGSIDTADHWALTKWDHNIVGNGFQATGSSGSYTGFNLLTSRFNVTSNVYLYAQNGSAGNVGFYNANNNSEAFWEFQTNDRGQVAIKNTDSRGGYLTPPAASQDSSYPTALNATSPNPYYYDLTTSNGTLISSPTLIDTGNAGTSGSYNIDLTNLPTNATLTFEVYLDDVDTGIGLTVTSGNTSQISNVVVTPTMTSATVTYDWTANGTTNGNVEYYYYKEGNEPTTPVWTPATNNEGSNTFTLSDLDSVSSYVLVMRTDNNDLTITSYDFQTLFEPGVISTATASIDATDPNAIDIDYTLESYYDSLPWVIYTVNDTAYLDYGATPGTNQIVIQNLTPGTYHLTIYVVDGLVTDLGTITIS